MEEVQPAETDISEPRKKKVVKKVKKDVDFDYIQQLIDMEIPKTELEEFEKPEFDMTPKKKPKKKKPTETEAIVIEELPEEFVEIKVPKEDGEVVVQTITKKILKKKQGPRNEVIEVKTVEEEGKEPEHEISIVSVDNQPNESTPSISTHILQNIRTEELPDVLEDLLLEAIPEAGDSDKPKFRKKKPKSKATEFEEPVVPFESDMPLTSLLIEEAPLEIIITETPTEDGSTVKKIAKKRTVKKQQGPDEQIIELISVEEDGKELETILTITEDKPTTDGRRVKRKMVKKLKKSPEDEYIQQLIEMEIPKTDLETFEKPEFEVTEKPKTKPKLKLTPIIRKDQKPTKVVVVQSEDLPKAVKLALKKPKQQKKEALVEALPTFKLKSRMAHIEYPPVATKLIIKKLKTVRGNGEISRNIEEAVKRLKVKKIKKAKISDERRDSLERPDLEKYEPYESSSEESTGKKPYERKKKDKEERVDENKTLKIGRGKVKSQAAETPEDIKLKPVPEKMQRAGEDTIPAPKKHKSKITEEKPEKPDEEVDMGKVPPFDFEPRDIPSDEISSVEHSPENSCEDKPKKQKHIRKKKSKPEPDSDQLSLVKGVPKPQEEIPPEEITLKYAQRPLPQEDEENVTLKPFTKPVKEGDKAHTDTQPETITPAVPERTDSDSETQKLTHTRIKKIKKPHKAHKPTESKFFTDHIYNTNSHRFRRFILFDYVVIICVAAHCVQDDSCAVN